jgi:curved DNA-binding protein
MIFKDYYKILGFDDNRASNDDIRKAFREQAKKYHPDVNKGNVSYEERFKDINEAYNILSNPTSKRKYDRKWKANVGKMRERQNRKNDKASDELVNILFGNPNESDEYYSKKKAVNGENIETSINIDLEEAFYGKTKNLVLKDINGNEKEVEVNIPAGVRNKEVLVISGKGKPGIDGGKSGYLLLQINIKDDVFTLKGNDLQLDIDIEPWEAALGNKKEIKDIDQTLKIYVPKGTKSGDRIEIPGKGYRDKEGNRGKLIIRLMINIIGKLSEKEIKLYEELKNIK